MISLTGLGALVVTALILSAATPLILIALFVLDIKAKEIW
ncbi:MAG: hypothetical protein HLUCCO02_04730 [Idiomarinaceae bacterium HL-53]|nr:MAG: hypothetical protein HLUCCO02_04730 [Idiomarinaceae bacterium HL-53]CUS49322.1 hypothetical protein Ga0003345_2310 [Idiomarinaceae bacterium HL-53]